MRLRSAGLSSIKSSQCSVVWAEFQRCNEWTGSKSMSRSAFAYVPVFSTGDASASGLNWLRIVPS